MLGLHLSMRSFATTARGDGYKWSGSERPSQLVIVDKTRQEAKKICCRTSAIVQVRSDNEVVTAAINDMKHYLAMSAMHSGPSRPSGRFSRVLYMWVGGCQRQNLGGMKFMPRSSFSISFHPSPVPCDKKHRTIIDSLFSLL